MGTKLFELLPKLDIKSWKSGQGRVSLATFLVAAFLLGISVLIGLILVIKVFMKPATSESLTKLGLGFLASTGEVLNVGEVVTLGIVFLIGMVVALVSIYIFNNQALQKVVRLYAWLCAGFGLYVYVKVAYNFYTRNFLFADRFPKYLLALAVVFAAVYVLPMLFDRYEVKLFSVPVFIGNFIHLMLILGQNIFKGSGDLSRPVVFYTHHIFEYWIAIVAKKPDIKFEPALGPDLYYFLGDIFLLLLMVAIAISFVRNAPLFTAIKRQLEMLFPSDS